MNLTHQHEYCFETLANSLRLEILTLLKDGPRNVSELAAATKAERSRVSHALQMLRDCRLVTATKRGREVRYELNKDTPLVQKREGTLFTIIEEHAAHACARCHKHGKAPAFR